MRSVLIEIYREELLWLGAMDRMPQNRVNKNVYPGEIIGWKVGRGKGG